MHSVALLLGGNQGDRHALIHRATELIRQRIGFVALASALYETEPWGDFEIQNSEYEIQNFLNQALVVDTPLSPHDLLHEALAIEHTLGRRRPTSTGCSPCQGELPAGVRGGCSADTVLPLRPSATSPCEGEEPDTPLTPASAVQRRLYHSRPIDIDIIFYDSEVIDEPDLTVPHPRMHLRRFVLEPLCEVMPDYLHPLLHKTVKQLLTEL